VKIRDVEVAVLAAPGDYGIAAGGGDSHGPRHTCVFLAHTDEGTWDEFVQTLRTTGLRSLILTLSSLGLRSRPP
jgi:hypothetical protein